MCKEIKKVAKYFHGYLFLFQIFIKPISHFTKPSNSMFRFSTITFLHSNNKT